MKAFSVGVWRIIIHTKILWVDFNFGGDWFVFWWHKGRPVLYRSADATHPGGSGGGKFYFGSQRDL